MCKKEDAPLSRKALQFFGQLFSHDSIANFLGHQSKSLNDINDLLIDFEYIQREKMNKRNWQDQMNWENRINWQIGVCCQELIEFCGTNEHSITRVVPEYNRWSTSSGKFCSKFFQLFQTFSKKKKKNYKSHFM